MQTKRLLLIFPNLNLQRALSLNLNRKCLTDKCVLNTSDLFKLCLSHQVWNKLHIYTVLKPAGYCPPSYVDSVYAFPTLERKTANTFFKCYSFAGQRLNEINFKYSEAKFHFWNSIFPKSSKKFWEIVQSIKNIALLCLFASIATRYYGRPS